MELKDTVDGMLSADHKERLLAECQQLETRMYKLRKVILGYYERKLDFALSCPIYVLEAQLCAMEGYRQVLRHRLYFEGMIQRIDVPLPHLDTCEMFSSNARIVKRNTFDGEWD